jgi:transposase-like protein
MNEYNETQIFEIGLCPKCGSEHIRVEKTKKPLRRMACDDCRAIWETLTINLLAPGILAQAAKIQRQKEELDLKFPFL